MSIGLIFLALGTALGVLFIVLVFVGGKYDEMIEPLQGDMFPLKEIYSAGLAIVGMPIFKLNGPIAAKLRKDTKLYFGVQFSEYYTRVILAQAYSFGLFIMAAFLMLAGMSNGSEFFFFLVGVAATGVIAYYFITMIGEKIKTRETKCIEEFPNVISKLALLVNSGLILHNAWKMVAEGKEGEIYDIMKQSCENMKNGASDIDALYEFGVMCCSEEIKKFTTALIQSIERGGGELPSFLTNQSQELWASKRQYLLQKGEKAAGALLAPIGLMFAGIMLLVVSAALQSFSL